MAHGHRPQTTPVKSLRSIILASASPRRRVLFKTFGLAYRVITPRVKERHEDYGHPRRLVAHNARLKARAVARKVRRGVIVSADTIVVHDGRVFGKPSGVAQARAMLQTLGGRTHRVYTGVCVLDVERRRCWVDVEVTRVRLRRLSSTQIDAYLRRVNPWDKAGAYAVQDVSGLLIDRIDGSLSNVVGLPLHVVERRLRQCGAL